MLTRWATAAGRRVCWAGVAGERQSASYPAITLRAVRSSGARVCVHPVVQPRNSVETMDPACIRTCVQPGQPGQMSTGQASAKKMDESGEEKKRRGPRIQTLQRTKKVTRKVPFSWVATYEFDDAHPSLKEINAQRLAQRKAERQKALQQRSQLRRRRPGRRTRAVHDGRACGAEEQQKRWSCRSHVLLMVAVWRCRAVGWSPVTASDSEMRRRN